jgi:beta-lactamase regulating signal transducer with metallopeptidase domain
MDRPERELDENTNETTEQPIDEAPESQHPSESAGEGTPRENQHSHDQLGEEIFQEVTGAASAQPLRALPNQNPNHKLKERVHDLLNEKKEQRRMLLRFVIGMTVASFVLLCVIVIWQGYVRTFCDRDFLIVNDMQYNLIVVGVFGQLIGLVVSIVKLLWNDHKLIHKLMSLK